MQAVGDRVTGQDFLHRVFDLFAEDPCCRLHGNGGHRAVDFVLCCGYLNGMDPVPENCKFCLVNPFDRVPPEGRLEYFADRCQQW